MLINLSDVLSEQHKTIETDASLEMKVFRSKLGKFNILDKEPVHLVIRHVKEREIIIEGKTSVVIAIPCDRCLEEVKKVFDLDLIKAIDLDKSDADLVEGLDESNYIDGYNLDVDKLLYNEILIGWPMKILCKDNCKGICNVCGQNLNEGSCDCEDTGLDPRMSVIRDVFKNFKEV